MKDFVFIEKYSFIETGSLSRRRAHHAHSVHLIG